MTNLNVQELTQDEIVNNSGGTLIGPVLLGFISQYIMQEFARGYNDGYNDAMNS